MLRADFPSSEQRFHGQPLAYLDSAVSAQKPRQVLDAQREFYETSYTNVHRGVYLLAERATERFERAREEKVRAFINAASTRASDSQSALDEEHLARDDQPGAATAGRPYRHSLRLAQLDPRPARDTFSTYPAIELVAQYDGRVPAWSLPGLPALIVAHRT